MSAPQPVLLVIVAHPDDEVLGAGGLIARRASAGWRVEVVLACGGATSRDPAGSGGMVDRVRLQAERAGATLGVGAIHHLGFPDQELDKVGPLALARAIDAIVEASRPDEVVTHFPGDYNWDHRAVAEATVHACRASPGEHAPATVLFCEVPSATERSVAGFNPDTFVDIAAWLADKTRALECYEDEIRAAPHPRSVNYVRHLAHLRGMAVGLQAAESFMTFRRIEG